MARKTRKAQGGDGRELSATLSAAEVAPNKAHIRAAATSPKTELYCWTSADLVPAEVADLVPGDRALHQATKLAADECSEHPVVNRRQNKAPDSREQQGKDGGPKSKQHRTLADAGGGQTSPERQKGPVGRLNPAHPLINKPEGLGKDRPGVTR